MTFEAGVATDAIITGISGFGANGRGGMSIVTNGLDKFITQGNNNCC